MPSSSPPHSLSGQSGRDFYAGLYADDVARQAEWLRRTASQKVESIAEVLQRRGAHLESILEVGAGTGAVIQGLRDRGVGRRHYAVDFSAAALAHLAERAPDIETAVVDITDVPDPFGRGPYGAVVASHVVEHLEEPGAFLRALRDVPMHVMVAEVPLENLPLGRVKARFSTRANHPAGHVQFYTRQSFVDELQAAGWDVLEVRVYPPVLDADTFAFSYGGATVARRVHKALTERILPRWTGPLWTRLYHAHCTVLCEPCT